MARKTKPEEAVAKLAAIVAAMGAKGKDVVRVSGHVLKSCAELTAAEADKAEVQNQFAGIHNRAEGTFGLNKAALKTLYRFSKMNEGKKADYLRTLLPGLEAMMPEQVDLFAEEAPDADASEDESSEGATLQ